MEFEDIICKFCHKYDYCKKCEQLRHENIATNTKKFKKPSRIRNCQTAICELHYTKINNKDVLEIGCGNKKKGELLKKIVVGNNCRWIGIDIKKTDLATHVCSVTHMPFDDNSFDCVIGSQTLEHWKRPQKALKEIQRVLKPEGKVYLAAPIHLHGSKIFVSGDYDSIEKLLLKSGFKIEKIERWGKNYGDLGPFLHSSAKKHLRYVKEYLRKTKTRNYEELTIYIIHCILTKNKVRATKFWW